MNGRSGSVEATQIATAAALSWFIIMSLAFIGALAAEADLGHHPLSEFAVLFVPVMTVPTAKLAARRECLSILFQLLPPSPSAPFSRNFALHHCFAASTPQLTLVKFKHRVVNFAGRC